MPQTSSSGKSQRQAATAFHSRIVTFMVFCWSCVGRAGDGNDQPKEAAVWEGGEKGGEGSLSLSLGWGLGLR